MPRTPEERAAANRRNAQRSTGPKTEQGKAVSRANALKHGLAATTLAPVDAPGEPAGAYQARLDLFLADTEPRNVLELVMIERACRTSWKLDRVARYEHAAAADRLAAPGPDHMTRVREAEELGTVLMHAISFDDDAEEDDDYPLPYAPDDWDDAARDADALGRFKEGVEWLLDQWSGILHGLPVAGGPPPEGSRVFLRRARRRALRLLGVATGLPDPAQPLREAGEAEVRRLEARLKEMSAGGTDRADADLSLFADSPDAQLLMRYEAQAERELHRAVNTFLKLRKDPAPVPTPAPAEAAPAPPTPAAPSEPARPAARPAADSPAPNEATRPGHPRPSASRRPTRNGRPTPRIASP